MFLPTSPPYYTPENTDILNKLRNAYPHEQLKCTLQGQCFIVLINNTGEIKFKYYCIEFHNVTSNIIKFVLDHTGCDYYIIKERSRTVKIMCPEYDNSIYVLPSSRIANEIVYRIYFSNYDYAGTFSRKNELYLISWFENIHTLILTLKNINEIVLISRDGFRYIPNEVRQLFDENFLWIPPKRESPYFSIN